MKPTNYRILIIVAIPLLLIGMYLMSSTSQDQGSVTDDFVHPTIPGGNGMLRAQGDDSPTSAGGLAPSSENVADTYYHEIFVLEETLARTPSDTLAMLKLGRLFQDGHKLPEADKQYSDYLALNPNARQVWLDLAATRALDKRYPDAEAAIHSMLELYPGDASALYNLGAIAANSGDLERARTIWQELVDQSDDATITGMATRSLARLNTKQR